MNRAERTTIVRRMEGINKVILQLNMRMSNLRRQRKSLELYTTIQIYLSDYRDMLQKKLDVDIY